MTRARSCPRIVLTAVLGALAVATPDARLQVPLYRTATRLVVLEATVKNDRGELVTDLDREAFRVFEDGRPQTIALFTRDDVPVSLGVLIDNSGSMRSLRAKVESAALTFARASNPRDEIFVLNFADTPRIDVPFTSDVAVLARGIARADSIGGTALRDALRLGASYVAQGTHDRKALVVITDGRDNGSVTTLKQLTHQAELQGVVVHGIGLTGGADAPPVTIDDLDNLAEHTGGVVYYPPTLAAIESAATDLARQIRRRYTIAYAPANQALDGSHRSITLKVRGAEHLEARTRSGYIAARQ